MFNFTKKESVKMLENDKAQSSVIGFFIGAMVAVIVALQTLKVFKIKFKGQESDLACGRCCPQYGYNYFKHEFFRSDFGQLDTIIPGIKNILIM